MARCGCVKKCDCIILDGICTVVKTTAVASGDCTSPVLTYSIDIKVDNETITCGPNGLQATLFTLDTNTIDLEGAGTAASPLEAHVIRTPDGNVPDPNALGTGNLIKELPGPGGGIYVSCEDVQDCVGAAISQIATDDCLVYDDATNTISISICAEPNGIECVPVGGDPACPAGGLAVFPSSDANNSLIFGTDGRLYKPAVAVAPGDCMTFTGTGTAGDPFVVTPLIAPEQNGIECVPGSGLLVTPSADANNGLVFGGDQRLWINRCPLTLGGSQVLTGSAGPCFELVGGDCGVPMVATLRLSDDICQGLQCRGDGLFVEVDTTEQPANIQQTFNLAAGPFNGFIPVDTLFIVPTTCLQMTNPSPCRSLLTYGAMTMTAETGRTSGAFRLAGVVRPNSPVDLRFGVIQIGQTNPTPPSRQTASGFWSGSPFYIGPGGTRTICYEVSYNANDPGQPVVNGRVFAGTVTIELRSNWGT